MRIAIAGISIEVMLNSPLLTEALFPQPSPGPQTYHIVFSSKGVDLLMTELDKKPSSEEQAQDAAERLFNSGSVEGYIKRNLNSQRKGCQPFLWFPGILRSATVRHA